MNLLFLSKFLADDFGYVANLLELNDSSINKDTNTFLLKLWGS